MTTLSELVSSRELLANLTMRELRGKYKRSVLGWSWSLLNPLATMLIFSLVFRVILKVDVPEGDPSGLHTFAFFLLCGLLPWNFHANCLNGSMLALLGNANLIKKTYFPREILVAATVGAWFASLLIELAVLAVALLIAGNFVLPWLLPLIVIVVLQAVLALGVGLAFSVLNVYFRDTQHFVGILLQFWFYATPVVYPLSLVPNHTEVLGARIPLRTLYELNPLVRVVECVRDLMYDLRWPPATDVAYIAGCAAVALVGGWAVFKRFEPRLAEEL